MTARAITGDDASPSAVSFEHPAPAETAEHARVFRCPVRFEAARYEIHVSNAVLAMPVRSANADLAEILDSRAKMLLAKLPPRALLIDRVRSTIARGLPQGRDRRGHAERRRASERSNALLAGAAGAGSVVVTEGENIVVAHGRRSPLTRVARRVRVPPIGDVRCSRV